jgi:hypothetical protein
VSESREYGDYLVQVTEYAGGYQAAIYPKEKGVKPIDWETEIIWSPNILGAYNIAQQRIIAALAA